MPWSYLIRPRALFSLLPICFSLPAHAGDAELNFQGMTGQINIPSAMVLEKGTGEFLYANVYEVDRRITSGPRYDDGINLNLGIGLVDGIEVVMRDVGAEWDGGSDMSANVKWQLPFIPQDWFQLAVGVQDVGGAASHYDGKYVVASKVFQYLTLTGGWGTTDSAYGTLDGVFYGVEATPFTWMSLLAEHDAADEHYGIRLSTPESWLPGSAKLSFTGMASSSNQDLEDDHFWGLSLSFPLGTNQPRSPVRPMEPASDRREQAAATGRLPAASAPVPGARSVESHVDPQPVASEPLVSARAAPAPMPESGDELNVLRDRLVEQGFENVRVGTRGTELVVSFENGIFNANGLDAMGVVIGEVVHQAPSSANAYAVVMQRNGINVLSMAGNIDAYRVFLAREAGLPADTAIVQSPGRAVTQGVQWGSGGGDRVMLVPRVELGPEIETVVGSEVGMLDYTLALNTQFELPLAKGLSLYAAHNTAIDNSDDYEDGWYQSRAKETEWREAYLSQAFVLPYNLTTMFQAGRTSYGNQEFTYGQNETTLDLHEGRIQLGIVMGHYVDDEYEDEWPVALGSARYYWAGPDVSFKVTGGNFLGQDVGFKAESRHYFGDTQIYLVYRDTDTRMVGMGVALPLTPRKDMRPVSGFQLKGRGSWSYELNTVIGEERNPITFGVAAIPQTRNSISARYFNFDRLSPAYVKRHADRLRDAYERFH